MRVHTRLAAASVRLTLVISGISLMAEEKLAASKLFLWPFGTNQNSSFLLLSCCDKLQNPPRLIVLLQNERYFPPAFITFITAVVGNVWWSLSSTAIFKSFFFVSLPNNLELSVNMAWLRRSLLLVLGVGLSRRANEHQSNLHSAIILVRTCSHFFADHKERSGRGFLSSKVDACQKSDYDGFPAPKFHYRWNANTHHIVRG